MLQLQRLRAALSAASLSWKALRAAALAISSSISAIISAAANLAFIAASESAKIKIICSGSSSIETIRSEHGTTKSKTNSSIVKTSESLSD